MSAAHGNSTESRDALAELCQNYYDPVLAYLKRVGENEDAAHDFFQQLLEGDRMQKLEREKGRFRSYLLGALKHFLSHRRSHQLAAKRGGGAEQFSLNETGAGVAIEDPGAAPPDIWFDQQWAMAMLSRALTRVETECREAGTETQFQHLSPWLTGEAEHGDQAGLAERTGMPINTLKSVIHRLRRRFRAAVKEEIGRTLADPSRIEDEMEALFAALGGR
ncbi:MAG: DNA-directed RNA polymerase specialized sigma24 family protein [Verrucomicrobiales bacterium]|jgi:DNA-directed RNA polymerase specialized sigma24 family protein